MNSDCYNGLMVQRLIKFTLGLNILPLYSLRVTHNGILKSIQTPDLIYLNKCFLKGTRISQNEKNSLNLFENQCSITFTEYNYDLTAVTVISNTIYHSIF